MSNGNDHRKEGRKPLEGKSQQRSRPFERMRRAPQTYLRHTLMLLLQRRSILDERILARSVIRLVIALIVPVGVDLHARRLRGLARVRRERYVDNACICRVAFSRTSAGSGHPPISRSLLSATSSGPFSARRPDRAQLEGIRHHRP